MRLGLVGYTNKASGIGMFIWEFWKYLDADSILSINAGIKGQEVWTDRQLTAGRPPNQREITRYFEEFEPTHVMFLETPFSTSLYDLAPKYGVKTVGVVMHETYEVGRLRPDLLICPSIEAWGKTENRRRECLFLPIGLEMFPFRPRMGHDFLLNIGYGGPHDRRQSIRTVQAFTWLEDPYARLIMHTQAQDWPPEIKEMARNDPRISLDFGEKPEPKDIYEVGDIQLAPMAYGGYERQILEGMACGMPTLTVAAGPMDLFQHDPDFLMMPHPWLIKQSQWVTNTWYNAVEAGEILERMRWLLEIDTEKYSLRARKQAEVQSWESVIDYKNIWLETIESA